MSAPHVPKPIKGEVEMSGEGGTLRLDVRDWAAAMLTAFDYGWFPTGPRARVYTKAAAVLAGPEDRMITLLFASEEQDHMARSGLGLPAFSSRDAEDLADSLETALEHTTGSDSQPPGGVPVLRLLMREFDCERSLEWRAANRTQVIGEVMAFARRGPFEVTASPL